MGSSSDLVGSNNLGYAVIYVCVFFAFIFLGNGNKKDSKATYCWSIGFFLNALGFISWSGILPIKKGILFILGEVFHVAGFLLLVYGIILFFNIKIKLHTKILITTLIITWIIFILLLPSHVTLSGFALRFIRSLLFISTGILILNQKNKKGFVGNRLAGFSLLAWGLMILGTAIRSAFKMYSPQIGIIIYAALVGFHILAAFGIVAMIIDRLRIQTEEREKHIKQLEGIMPICSYCKKIRDEKNQWLRLEEYIEDRSTAEFSHSICPECFVKHRPDR